MPNSYPAKCFRAVALLLAQTGVDAGSTTKPFRNLFIAGTWTYGTNYLEFTGAPTAARVVTVPDATSDTKNFTQVFINDGTTAIVPFVGNSKTLGNGKVVQ